MIDLELEIGRWKRSLRRENHLQDADITELESHLRDEIDHGIGTGLDPEAAFRAAIKNSASADMLDREYEKFRPLDTRRPFWHPARLLPIQAWSSIKFALRIFRRSVTPSLLSVLGLGVGLACALLFYFSWQYERSFDHGVPNAANIYRVERNIQNNATVSAGVVINPSPLAPAAKAFPEVQAATRWLEFRDSVIQKEDRAQPLPLIYGVDEEFFRVFGPSLVKGGPPTALADPSSIFLSERTAAVLFGRDDPIGRRLRVVLGNNPANTTDFMVAGILKNPPPNSIYPFDALVSLQNAFKNRPGALSNWNFSAYPTFLSLRPDADLAEVARKLDALRPANRRNTAQVKESTVLSRLSDIHMADPILRKELRIFGTIALVVLFLACINSINLATARALSRTKEVAVRKIAGANRKHLFWHFICESAILTGAALAAAIAGLSLVLPAFPSLAGRGLVIGALGGGRILAGLAGLFVLVVAAAGAYPAVYLAAIQPAELFQKSGSAGTSRSLLRKTLVFAQFAISGILLVITLVVSRQMTYIRKADLGMETKNLVVLRTDIRRLQEAGALDPLKAELSKSPHVLGVSSSRLIPPNMTDVLTFKEAGAADSDKMAWTANYTDPEFLSTFGLAVREGRFFSKDRGADVHSTVVLNEAAARALGPGSPVGKTIEMIQGPNGEYRDRYTVIGIVKDFHSRSLHFGIEPMALFNYAANNPYLIVKISPAGGAAALDDIRAAWSKMHPDILLDFFFLDDALRSAYESDHRLRQLTLIFSGLAVLIGCLGLSGLVTFSTGQRRKEMGVRKILGASMPSLVSLFFREFGKPAGLSVLMAWPAAYYLAQRWLRDFAFRTNLPAWPFVVSGAGLLLIAFLTVAVHVSRAAKESPVESLRFE